MKKNMIEKARKGALILATVTTLFCSMPVQALAADTTTAEAQAIETVADVSGNSVETTEIPENPSVEDLFNQVTETDEVETEKLADLTIEVPANTVLKKNGVTLTSFEEGVKLSDGTLTLSQPTAAEYKERIESDVTVTIENAEVAVEFLGQNVSGQVTDDLGNVVSFDGSTVSIINADKMADMPSEDDADQPEEPDEVPADYTVRYFVNSVSEENLLGTLSVPGTEGATIDMESVDVNMHKPVDGEGLVWADGVIQDGAATVITADDTDVIDIVYVSETVVTEGDASFTVQYYKDDLVEGNFLGQYEVAANNGTNIDYSTIDVNMFQPSGYGNGDIQTVVSAKVVTEDNSDVVYVLYTAVETVTKTVTETIVEEKIVEVEVEVEKEVEKSTATSSTSTVTEYVDRPVPVFIDRPVHIIKTVTVEKKVPVYLYRDRQVQKQEEDEKSTTIVEENPDPETDEDTPDEYEDGPQTADVTEIAKYVVLAFGSLIGILVIVILAIRKKKTTNK